MKILVDTNVVLDVLCNRTEFCDEATKVFTLCGIGKIEGFISALSIPNIVYIMRKEIDFAGIEHIFKKIEALFAIEDLKACDLSDALILKFNDYEDALQSVCASRVGVDFIVTRNVRDYAKSPVIAITPHDFLKIYGSEVDNSINDGH